MAGEKRLSDLDPLFLCKFAATDAPTSGLTSIGTGAVPHFGGINPGELTHPLMCEALSACRARRKSNSFAMLPGVCFSAASRNRRASSVNRSSKVAFRAISPPLFTIFEILRSLACTCQSGSGL
jgi:hypothetical protein